VKSFEYRAPTSLDEVYALLDQYGDAARLIAGGTALVILMKQGLVQPEVLVSLSGVPELHRTNLLDGTLHIGACITHFEAETSELTRTHAPSLAETLHHVATVRIRNVGTIGGNLAHADPNLDPPATLIALGASVEVASKRGERLVPIEEFFTDYYSTVLEAGEIVRGVRVPSAAPRCATVFHKFLPRTADDYATVAVATTLQLAPDGSRCEDLRLGLGSVGPTPIRARRAEEVLRGQSVSSDRIAEGARVAASEVDPITDIRGSAEYKRDMVAVWVRRTLTQASAAAREAAARDGAGSA